MNERVEVKALTGRYVGRRTDNARIEFLGIRYAKTPMRWKRAEKLEPSDKLIDASEYAPIPSAAIEAFEYPDGEPYSCEGALSLNIYTSSVETKKPVYVFIHGGSFLNGSASIKCSEGMFCGDNFVLAHPDIVYVNITYRTGVLGSLDLRSVDPDGEYKDSMNLNTLDQMRALEWIYENIEAFGGDKDHITIGGQSAGSYSCFVLMMIPEARKYFKAAILESSAPTDDEMKTLDAAALSAKIFMDIAGVHSLNGLLSLPVDDVVKYGAEMFMKGPRGSTSPTRDGVLVPLMPEAALTEAAASGIVWLSGCNEGEYDSMTYYMENNAIREMLKRRNPGCTDEDIDAFIANYPERDEKTALMDMHNDCGMRIRQTLTTEAYVKGGGKVFQYYTVFKPESNYLRCQHCTELAAVAGKPYIHVSLADLKEEQWLLGKEPDFGYTRLINDIWANFIRTYDPNGGCVNTSWVPYSLSGKETAVIGNAGEIHMENEPRTKDMDIARKLQH